MISNTTVKITYSGNGTTRSWSIPFSYTDASQVCVLTTVNSIETVIAAANYTVDSAAKAVIYPKVGTDPLATGTTITLYRVTPNTQESDLTNQGGAWPETIESGLDKLTQMSQEQTETLERCIKVQKSSSTDPDALMAELKADAESATTAAAAAATSETNAAASQASAASSASAANTSETNAAASASAASTSASAAAASATSANASQAAASLSASASATSAANASASETAAASSAASANNSKTAAATSEANAKVSEANARTLAESVNPPWNIRMSGHTYAVGDVAYSASLPSWARLECVTAGTTAATEPAGFANVSTGGGTSS